MSSVDFVGRASTKVVFLSRYLKENAKMKKTRLVQMLEKAIDEAGGTQARFAEANGFSQQTVNTWMNGRVPTRQFHGKLAVILNVSDEMISELIEEAEAARAVTKTLDVRYAVAGAEAPNGTLVSGVSPHMDQLARVPVYGRAVGGEVGEYEFNGQVLDWVSRPPSLAGVKDAYAVFVDGESMVPAYKPGQTAWVHPTRPPRRGDDVVVQLHGADEYAIPRGYIKEFVGWTATKLVLQQHNPPKKVEFDRDMVRTVDTIVFSERA